MAMKAGWLGLVAAVLLAGCGVKEAVADGDAKVTAFHADYDAQRYDAIWGNAARDLTGAAGAREQLTGLLRAAHNRLGKVTGTQRVGFNAATNTNGTFVVLTMNTTFERGTGQEEFVFRKEGETYRLAGYHIKSNELNGSPPPPSAAPSAPTSIT